MAMSGLRGPPQCMPVLCPTCPITDVACHRLLHFVSAFCSTANSAVVTFSLKCESGLVIPGI
jgi:hypothetical protein